MSELNFVDDVYDKASEYFRTDNAIIIITGDISADCSNFSQEENNLYLIRYERFHLINENTTAAATNCSCDRYTFVGDNLIIISKEQRILHLRSKNSRGDSLYTEVSSFQGVGIEEFHCIQRCPHFRVLE